VSRIGKNPVPIPTEVEIKIQGQNITAKGPKGELNLAIHPQIAVEQNNSKIIVSMKQEDRKTRALWGLSRTLLANLIEGVSKGFEKKLIITGVGYKAALKGKDIELQLGFSHPVLEKAPAGIEFVVDTKKNEITVKGIDKQLVGEVAANIRKWRKPEPYKGKGIAYAGEYIPRKAGKAAGKDK
jgi:large subunit ribosomal protein L6